MQRHQTEIDHDERGPRDPFDIQLGIVDGFPMTRPSTIVATPLLGVGGTTTWIVQTSRVPDGGGDTIFLQALAANGTAYRIAVPPKVADAIARQRDQLTKRSRSAAARASAASRPPRSFTAEDRAKAAASRARKAAAKRAKRQG